MNILITTSSFGVLDNSVFEPFKQTGLSYELNPYGRALTESEAIDLNRKYSPIGLIAGTEPITSRVLNANKCLKIISRAGVGISNIDLEATSARGIVIRNTPDVLTCAVAELTVGLIISMIRHINHSDRMLRSGKWCKKLGHLLNGKTVGIAGCGNIGCATAKLLSAFGCNVIGFDPFTNSCGIIKIISEKDNFLSISDIITLHMPLTSENNYFIDTEALKKMKKNAFLVNTSRGGLIDEKALLESLNNNHLAGAALDTFENEPYSGPLTKHDRVLLTPHIGSYAQESRIQMEKQAVENLVQSLIALGII